MTDEATTRSATSSVEIGPEWRSWAGVHGGYLVAQGAAACRDLAGGFPLRSIHAMFLRPVTATSSTIEVGLVRRGGSTRILAAELTPDDGLGTAVRLQILVGDRGAGPFVTGLPSPAVPAADQCDQFSLPVDLVPFGQKVEIRPATDVLPLVGGSLAELTAWMRLELPELTAEERFIVLVDALPPALYGVLSRPVPIPTVDLTVHLTSAAADADPSGWYLVRITTQAAGGGWSLDASHIWDSEGRLMAEGHQARRVMDGH